MISRELKALYYGLFKYPMRLNGFIHRIFRSPKSGKVRVHLGPGQKNYLEGWINVDANLFTAKLDVWADLNNKLPFRDGSVDAFYSHHVIEHLPDRHLPRHFADMYRCLKPGGMIRVGGPNGDVAMRKFAENDSSWFGDFPDPHASIGGKLVNFVFCRNEHLTMLTQSYLEELVRGAGFTDPRVCAPGRETTRPELIDQAVFDHEPESTPDSPHTLLIEARK